MVPVRMFRKQLPLSLRMNVGWLRRSFGAHRIWDSAYFRDTYDWLQETQWWSRDQLEQYQLEQLQSLVRHAYENVPYYMRVFDEMKLKPRDIATFDDLLKIPLLTKEDVRKNREDLVARNVDRRRLRFATTGGSTGQPLSIYHEQPRTDLREWAFRYRQWGWAGYRLGDRYATMARGMIERIKMNGERASWDYSTDLNELVLSSTEMHDEYLHLYMELIRRFKPRFLCLYPSSALILGRFLDRHNITDIKLQAIFSDSEMLYPSTRELAESGFGCKIYDHYGLTEYVADAVQCEQLDGYHVNMEYGILELVDENTVPITDAYALGTVVGTGFGNYAMPLLRYVTSDLASFASEGCACGRDTVRMAEFRGRVGDFIVSNTGRLTTVNMLLGGHSLVWSKVREIKLRQEREGELIVIVAAASSVNEKELAKDIRDELYKYLDEDEFAIYVEMVDSIPRTGKRLKLAVLEQKLPLHLADVRHFSSGETPMGEGNSPSQQKLG
jgi:phenylacetate-CoA ligase